MTRLKTKILVDGGGPQETLRVKEFLGYVDGQTTNPSLIANNPHIKLASASDTEPVRELLLSLGEDPDREGRLHTPERMYKALQFLAKGYQEDPEEIRSDALFTVHYDEMVIVKDIEMFSLCEHHALPFFGKVHVSMKS